MLTSLLIWVTSGTRASDPRVIYRMDLFVLPLIILSALRFGPHSGTSAIAITILIEVALFVRGTS